MMLCRSLRGCRTSMERRCGWSCGRSNKRKALEPSLLEQVRRYAQTENLKRKAVDIKTLREYWDRLPAEQKRESRIAAAAAQSFIALGQCSEAHAIVEQSLDADWDPALLSLYVECVP